MAETRLWLAHYDADVPPTLEAYPDRTLLDYVSETARSQPDHPALLFKGHRVSYAQLERQSDAFAAALAARNVGIGDRVALCLPNTPQFVIAELAAWKIGAIVCPMNPTYSDRELEEALSTTGAATVVTLNRYYDKLKALQSRTSVQRFVATGIKEYLPFALRRGYTLLKEKAEGEHITVHGGDERFADLIAHHRDAARPPHRVAPNDLAVILMSAGTTGTPKGVVGTHRASSWPVISFARGSGARCTSGPIPSCSRSRCSTRTGTQACRASRSSTTIRSA